MNSNLAIICFLKVVASFSERNSNLSHEINNKCKACWISEIFENFVSICFDVLNVARSRKPNLLEVLLKRAHDQGQRYSFCQLNVAPQLL